MTLIRLLKVIDKQQKRKCKGCGKETNFMASFCPDCRKVIENTYKELMK